MKNSRETSQRQQLQLEESHKSSEPVSQLFARRKSSQETPHKRIFGAMVSRLELLQKYGAKLPATSRANESSRILIDLAKGANYSRRPSQKRIHDRTFIQENAFP